MCINSWNLIEFIRKSFFVCECCIWTGGYISLIIIFRFFLTSVSNIFCWNFKIIVKRLYNPNAFDTEILINWTLHISLRCVCVYMSVCTPPLMCMWWVGWLYVSPCHLVAPTGFAKATVRVTLRQFAPHRLISFFLKCYFFTGSVSAYGAHSILLLFSSLLLFFCCSVPLVVLDRLKLL